ncbi:MAG: hypothetical protein COT85_03490 [Chlamydiae bacterium CG10_big_fil_rev_8_21_14_0_10_42_34]|nr:MAG: hypothetical protein COT85_03490 [Chlamydiae bacterium CG10_big_fil_rev_8_21_14_0_10_42_34]
MLPGRRFFSGSTEKNSKGFSLRCGFSCTPKGRRFASNRSQSYHASQAVGLLLPKQKNPSFRLGLFRTRSSPIRTSALLPVQIKIPCNEDIPVYQRISQKIKELKALGLTNQEIADSMKIGRKTVTAGLSIQL